MEAMEARLLAKLSKLDGLEDKFVSLESKLDQQAQRMDQVQIKVDLSMEKLSKLEEEQIAVSVAVKNKEVTNPSRPPPVIIPQRPTSSIIGGRPASAPNLQVASFTPLYEPDETPEGSGARNHLELIHASEENQQRRPWMPRMDFPRFDGTDASIWVDTCETFFTLYQVAPGFQVSAATMYMTESAAHWYHSFKRTTEKLTWAQFRSAVLLEFDTDTHRVKMKELLQLRQTGTVAEYRRQFDRLVYNIKLYDPSIGGIMLVTQFILGLKDELRIAVEAQLPDTVQRATLMAQVHEQVFEQKAVTKPYKQFHQHNWKENKSKFVSGEVWKAQQLKEYRRQNNLCFKCGAKYAPGHQCPPVAVAQLKAIQMDDGQEILSDELLEVVTNLESLTLEEPERLSLHAISGTENDSTIRLPAQVNNLSMLMLIDSGSTSSFLDVSMVSKLGIIPQARQPVSVKVANGEQLICDSYVPGFTWYTQGVKFSHDMQVLDMGGYDAVLGIDWLAKFRPMNCDWVAKWIEFPYEGHTVKLQGVLQTTQDHLQEISLEQVIQLHRKNELWATALLENDSSVSVLPVPDVVRHLLQEFEEIFKEPTDLPPSRVFDHAITVIPGTTPVNARPYRYSPLQKDEIERQVAEMLRTGIITASISPYASPVLLVKKKDGQWRFCIDYRRLNAATIKNKFPMPVVDELLDELSGTKFFSKLYLRSGYHQIRMVDKDEEKTAFKTHHGHFQFRVMPFGLTNAPATFQCVMNSIFSGYIRRFVLVFMDDILVYSKSLEEHIQHLRVVFQILLHHKFYAKLSKCQFAATQLEYLGHIISDAGVATDKSKTEAMLLWPTPTNITELRGFLGLTGYYRKFVKHYGILAKPLTDLLQHNKTFVWTVAAQQAFDSLKKAMSQTPVLVLPDFNLPFVIETDACDNGIGAVLIQQGHPVAYLSKALGINNSKLPIYEKEFLAIMMAVDKWRAYLQRGPFTIKTDHKSLCCLEDQVLHTELQKKAMTKLIGLQYKFQFNKGVDNKPADALSRIGHAFQAISVVQPAWIQEVLNSYVVDSAAQALLKELAITGTNDQGFSLSHGLLHKDGKVWIGTNLGLQTKLITAFHSSALGGHSGMQATYHRLKNLFAWAGMKMAVEEFVKQCTICQHAKHENCKLPGLLQPLPAPSGPWQSVSMDFIDGLPKSAGYDVIFVVVDRYTKYAHFLPLKHPFTAATVAQLFLDNVVKLHSLPTSIASDRDKVFTSAFWQSLFKGLHTQLNLSTAYHPQTDGQTERVNQCLELYLRCSVAASPTKWVKWLPLAEYWYNTCFHTSLGCSPFKALYGNEPSHGLFPPGADTTSPDAAELLQERACLSDFLQQQLARASRRMKQAADGKRSFREFQVGEQVLLKLQPYVQKSVVHRPYPKLSFKYFGPFPVVARYGTVAYKLELPQGSQVHPVFHVSQLKTYIPDHTPVYNDLPTPLQLDVADLAPEEILDRRLVKKANASYLQVLIKCSTFPPDMATWEDYEILRKRFPEAAAWGHAATQEGGSVTQGVSQEELAPGETTTSSTSSYTEDVEE